MSNSKYDQRGVSAEKSEVHSAIQNLPLALFPKSFCKIYPDYLAFNNDWCCISHADGAGTKSSLAYMYWKETGDLDIWKGIAQDALYMNLDDMLCAGAINNFTYTSTIGRNKNLISGDVIKAIIDGTLECIETLNQYGIKIHFMGGETADVGDIVKTIIVDGNMTCRLPKFDVITNEKIAPNQVIVGFASFGKSIYEKVYNAGIGSNGLTSARHDIFKSEYIHKYPESFDNNLPKSVVYNGKYALTDEIDIINYGKINMGKLVLSPTRTFSPLIKEIFALHKNDIYGMIHCTGGGQTKCLKFVENIHIVKNNLFDTPLLFQIIQESANTDWKEMYKVFNMGSRLEIYTNENCADELIALAKYFGIEAQIIGYTTYNEKNKLTIQSKHGEFVYA